MMENTKTPDVSGCDLITTNADDEGCLATLLKGLAKACRLVRTQEGEKDEKEKGPGNLEEVSQAKTDW